MAFSFFFLFTTAFVLGLLFPFSPSHPSTNAQVEFRPRSETKALNSFSVAWLWPSQPRSRSGRKLDTEREGAHRIVSYLGVWELLDISRCRFESEADRSGEARGVSHPRR
ncbi:hypothetical protein LX36DRAFT_51848 [Colletotrichum falcatum]|nr:hypothetical protein LX36DRAFT_51848 [Colletotrichum falcatum]